MANPEYNPSVDPDIGRYEESGEKVDHDIDPELEAQLQESGYIPSQATIDSLAVDDTVVTDA